MSKRALLVGCNYPGTKVELHGCANDVKRMHTTLTTRFGFDESDILVLLDTQSDPARMPTGANIRSCLAKLIRGVEPGDVLVFHYSGHGTQVPQEAGSSDETGAEEAIVPTDMNLMTDDDFRDLVNQIPAGATFTFLSDSCHSGGLIDAEKEQIGGGAAGPGAATYTAGGQGGGGGGGGLMGLVSQGLQAYGGSQGGRGGKMMGMVSQGLSAFGNREVKTRDFEFPSGGRVHRDDEGGYSEGYGGERGRHYGGERGEEAGYGGRQYGEEVEGYEGGGRRQGAYEEYEREERRYGGGRGRGEEYGEYEEEGRRHGRGRGRGRGREEEYERERRQQAEEYGGDSYEQGQGGYEGRQQSYGAGGYGEEPYSRGGYGQAAPRVKSKEIPVGMLTQILSERTGHNVDIGNIRTTIFDMFGDQASPAIKTFVNLALQQMQGQGGWMGAVSSLATQMLQGKIDQDPGAAAEYTAPAEAAGQYRPPRQRMGESRDVGILLSGCQSDETSADANPTHNPKDSYGAFSNAIQTVLSQNNSPISNRELILEVRKVLEQGGFKQHPCLYCSDPNSDAVFICN